MSLAKIEIQLIITTNPSSTFHESFRYAPESEGWGETGLGRTTHWFERMNQLSIPNSPLPQTKPIEMTLSESSQVNRPVNT